MTVRWNLLVFPGGTEIGLEINRALRYCKEVRLFSAASQCSNHANSVYRNHFILPPVSEPGCLQQLNALIEQLGIDFIYPANDYVIDFLCDVRDELSCEVILPPTDAVKLMRSKSSAADRLFDILPSPHRYLSADAVADYPVFVKPDSAYGSQGAYRVENCCELEAYLLNDPDLLIQEYLPGTEYTVDCFSSRRKGLLFCAGRERGRVRMGTSMNARLVNGGLQPVLKDLAQQISGRLGLYGAWFFQVKEDAQGHLKLLEVEPRIAGTMAINRVRGANFPLLSLYEAVGEDLQIMLNGHELSMDRALTNRYISDITYRRIYVDLDDTLITSDGVNTQLVAFLYQALNNGCNITLLSKSLAEDKDAYLRHWRLSELFDKKIWLEEAQSKADFIDPVEAIFIDDSFSQRAEVQVRHGIPTFDVSMVESLLDERV